MPPLIHISYIYSPTKINAVFFSESFKMRMLWKSNDGRPICNQERLEKLFRVFAGTLHNLHTPKQSGFPICRKCATLLGKVIQRRLHDSASDPNADHTANKKETSAAYRQGLVYSKTAKMWNGIEEISKSWEQQVDPFQQTGHSTG